VRPLPVGSLDSRGVGVEFVRRLGCVRSLTAGRGEGQKAEVRILKIVTAGAQVRASLALMGLLPEYVIADLESVHATYAA
jgi:hypothetical protein